MPQSTPASPVAPYMLAAIVLTFGVTSAWSVLHSRKAAETSSEEPLPLFVPAPAGSIEMPAANKAERTELAPLVAVPAAPGLALAPPVAVVPASVEPTAAPLSKAAPAPALPKPVPAAGTRPGAPKQVTAVASPVPLKPALLPARSLALPPAIPAPPVPALPEGGAPTAPVSAGPAVSVAPAKAPPVVESTAPPVAVRAKPQVVAATADRAWVKLDSQRTVIVGVGETVPGLGTYRGKSGDSPRFD